jgi:predicted RNA binding protein YcfA (HicA-like mRNA interferase family)
VSLRPLPGKKVLKILSKLGFSPVRQRGSHVFLKHPDGRKVVVPIHSNEEIGPGLLFKITECLRFFVVLCPKLIFQLTHT